MAWDPGLIRTYFNLLQPSGHYTYHQFNIQQFYVLPTHCIYMFCVDLRTNSYYLTKQSQVTVFLTMVTVTKDFRMS